MKGSKSGTITFGVKMIEMCLSSKVKSTCWTHVKEIIDRGYFNGIITPQNILVAVVLHENAHYFQNLIFDRVDRSVHNDDFYKILDKMNFNGTAEKVTNYLMGFELFKNLEFSECDSDFALGKYTKKDFKKDDYFYYLNFENKEVFDIVSRLNSLKITTKRGSLVAYRRVLRIVEDKEDENIKKGAIKIKNKLKNIKVGAKIKIKNFKENLIIEKVRGRIVIAATTDGKKYRVPIVAILQCFNDYNT